LISNGFLTIDIETLAELPTAVTRLCADVLERVLPLQQVSGKPYSEIRIELWIDSGRAIAFPAESPLQQRTEVAGCQICCAELARSVADLDNADLPDTEYETRFSALESRIASVVRDSIGGKLDPVSIRDPDDNPL
jgi:hypothetical protein